MDSRAAQASQRRSRFTRRLWLTLAGINLTWLCSCSLLGLNGHLTKMEQYGSVTIQVTPPPKESAPTYALAWTTLDDGEMETVGYHRLRADGLAYFSLRTNFTYSVGAFTDENGTGRFEDGEPGGCVTNVHPSALNDPAARRKIRHFALTRDHHLPPNLVIDIVDTNNPLGTTVQIAVGDVAQLDDPQFASETGSRGLWRPFDFMCQNVPGIYYTEPYDPKRVPVVFVYGIGGSPQDWSYVMQHFDRTRYQLWFFHYPSGMRLAREAWSLAACLDILKERDGFAQCDVVAHSMGGLVSNEAIQEAVAREGTNFIAKFVSISTPWGGHEAASLGVRYLDKPVPSWKDVAPESDFLKSLYTNPVPSGTAHDLIYGEIPISAGVPGEDDGVVTVKSELDPRICKHATMVNHLPYGHVEILNQPQTTRLVLDFLDQPADGTR